MDSNQRKTNINTDETLLARLRTRAMDPLTRTDARASTDSLLYPPAPPEAIASVEACLGFALHPFLKRIYLEVANGGFGPGYGLLSLADSGGESDRDSLSSVYLEFHDDDWPEKLLPLWDWGGAAWSCLDGNSSEGTIVTHDDVDGATKTSFNLRSWLQAWVDGVDLWKEIYEDKDAILMNPFTRKPVSTKVRGVAKGVPFLKRSR